MTKKEASFILANIDRRVCDDEVSEALDIAIKTLEQNSKYRKEARRWKRKALEQKPCEDEYIKVPKKALKYRTAGMVAYNAEWLKNHFDIERAICGAQEPVLDKIREIVDMWAYRDSYDCMRKIADLVKPQESKK